MVREDRGAARPLCRLDRTPPVTPRNPCERPPFHKRRPREKRHSGSGCPVWRCRPWSSKGRKVRGARNAAKGELSAQGMPDTGRCRPGRKRFRPKKIHDPRCTGGNDRATLPNQKPRERIRRMQDRCVMLRATNPERNVNRSWVCRIERDLFGACVVSVTFGRTGTRGRTIRRTVPNDAAADEFLARAMARRRGSHRRCGASYRIIEASGIDGRVLASVCSQV